MNPQQTNNTNFPADDSAFLEAIQAGDLRKWEAFVTQWYDSLLGFVTGMVRDAEAAEELVQDVFVNIWTKRDQISISTSLKSYVFRAARNHALNFIKRRKFEWDYQRKLANEMPVGHKDTENAIEFSELERKLNKAIEELPDSCREIFRLSRFAEMTYKEIAETLDIPPRTVHYQIGLALKNLRSVLERDFGADFFTE